MTIIVSNTNGRATTTSLLIAEHFHKRHTNVIRAIRNIECSEEFNRLNFELVEYTDGKGEKRPCYNITRDGFVFLAMGFTGKEASAWKERYIKAFNEMESIINRRRGDYDFPLMSASPKNRCFANAWMTAEVLQSNRRIELDLLKKLKRDGYDVSGVEARILSYHLLTDELIRQNKAIKKAKEMLEGCQSERTGMNIVFTGLHKTQFKLF